MKLKYYLRGMGIGIVVTTILFMILITIHKNDEGQQELPGQNMESKTVAAAEEGNTQQSEHKDAQALEATEEGMKSGDGQQEPAAPEQAPESASEEKEPEKEEGEETEPQKSDSDDKVRFEISGGEYSDVVCRKLAEAGLVDSAQSFNQFLVEKDYDNAIMPGVYDIPKDSTYEEIAALLTTKVDAP